MAPQLPVGPGPTGRMELLNQLKSQWNPDKSPSDPSYLDEYGATIVSWLLGNTHQQIDVEALISQHLLPHEALLDHCSWEIVPLLSGEQWMRQSDVRSKFHFCFDLGLKYNF